MNVHDGTVMTRPDQILQSEITQGNTQKEFLYLLHLELDGGAHSVHLALKVVASVHQSGELTGFGQTGT